MFETLEGLLKTELNNTKYDAKKNGFEKKSKATFLFLNLKIILS